MPHGVDTKHPANYLIDRNDPASRTRIKDTLFASENRQGEYRQTDLYSQAGVNGYTVLVASVDFVEQTPGLDETSRLYYPVNAFRLQDAYTQANDPATRADPYVESAADRIVATLLRPGNEGVRIELEGHASLTGKHARHYLRDTHGHIRRDAHGHALSVPNNVWLSQQRDYFAEKAFEHAILARMEKTHPELIAQVAIHSTARGDSDPHVKTTKEHTANRCVDIHIVSKPVETVDRIPRLYHLSADEITDHQIRQEPIVWDLGLRSDAAQRIIARNPGKTPLPVYGAMLMETTDIERPVDIHVTPDKAEDLTFLVSNPSHAKNISYTREGENVVVVSADSKPIAKLHYDMGRGAKLREEDIWVGGMDEHGHSRIVGREALADKHVLEAHATLERRQTDAKQAVAKAMNTDGDAVITKEELIAYQHTLNLHAAVAFRDGLSAQDIKDLIEFQTKRHGDAAGEKYRVMLKELSGGAPAISKAQIEAMNAQDVLFKEMLAKGDFQLPADGALPVATIGKTHASTPTLASNPNSRDQGRG